MRKKEDFLGMPLIMSKWCTIFVRTECSLTLCREAYLEIPLFSIRITWTILFMVRVQGVYMQIYHTLEQTH